MPLSNRKPRKLIRLSVVARQIGYTTETVKKKAIEHGVSIKRLSDAPNAPDMVYQAEAERFLEKLGV